MLSGLVASRSYPMELLLVAPTFHTRVKNTCLALPCLQNLSSGAATRASLRGCLTASPGGSPARLTRHRARRNFRPPRAGSPQFTPPASRFCQSAPAPRPLCLRPRRPPSAGFATAPLLPDPLKTPKVPPLRGRDFAASGAKNTRKVPPLRGRDFAPSGAKKNPFPDPFWGRKCFPKPSHVLAISGSEFLAKR